MGQQLQGAIIYDSEELNNGRDQCLSLFLIGMIFFFVIFLHQFTQKIIQFRDDSLRQKLAAYSENWPLHATQPVEETSCLAPQEKKLLFLEYAFKGYRGNASPILVEQLIDRTGIYSATTPFGQAQIASRVSNRRRDSPWSVPQPDKNVFPVARLLEDLGSADDSKIASLAGRKGGRLAKEVAPCFKDILKAVQQWRQLRDRADGRSTELQSDSLQLHEDSIVVN
ncbi:hypothetical protein PAXRUDRAFT_25291 [Paxillus rubicundulus Ve08.2h10]|uniref:Unplaced genomic scaffold scaffold_188, whole genome shotgun sequence n=1 Tax=Paxillus rubicundulus Ve08.2h10 TaxID=930991 RepID=A0A0D0DS10_9AGAM|nr:hypothetical protein PAXRUDRAFT_25291 [Paxillus rubicundulus Ve08.2h10]